MTQAIPAPAMKTPVQMPISGTNAGGPGLPAPNQQAISMQNQPQPGNGNVSPQQGSVPNNESSASAPTSEGLFDWMRRGDKNQMPYRRPVPTPAEVRVALISQLPPPVWDFAYHHSPDNTWSPAHMKHHLEGDKRQHNVSRQQATGFLTLLA